MWHLCESTLFLHCEKNPKILKNKQEYDVFYGNSPK